MGPTTVRNLTCSWALGAENGVPRFWRGAGVRNMDAICRGSVPPTYRVPSQSPVNAVYDGLKRVRVV